MSDDPIRLREDPRAASALRRDLALAAKFSAVPAGFDATAALARFDAARANVPASSSAHAIKARTARWWGVGAIGLATLIALGAWGAHRMWTSVASQTAIDGSNGAANGAGNRAQAARANTPAANVIPAATSPTSAVAHGAARDNSIGAQSAGSGGNAAATNTANGSLATAVLPSNSSASPSRGARRIVGATTDLGDDLLARDARMLTDAYAALAVDPARALSLANGGEREFPASSHQDEREAIAVRALVALRRIGEARARGERFLARSSTGPYAGAVRQALYEGPRDH